MSFVWFILLVGPLIFFHELGHFVAARYFGVGVVRFSIGFGPKIAGFTRGETEYVIGALPLGGFVKMLGMEPGELGELSEGERSKALWAKPIWQRSIITLAGPVANLILPLPIFFAFFAMQDERLPSEVGTVSAGMPAERAGLQPGDDIIAVDGEPVRYFDELRDAIGDAGERPVELTIVRGGEELQATLEPEMTRERDSWTHLRIVERPLIGIMGSTFAPILAVDAGTPAAAAGLRTFDRVAAVNGERVETYFGLDDVMARARGPVRLTVLRPEAVGAALGSWAVERPVEIELAPANPDGTHAPAWRAASMVLHTVLPGSPAEAAGLAPGDEIVSMDGRDYNLFGSLRAALVLSPGEEHSIVYRRAGVEHTTTLAAREMEVRGRFNEDARRAYVGMRSIGDAPGAYVSLPPVRVDSLGERLAFGFTQSFEALFGIILGLVVGVWQLISGQVGLSNLGGPLMIADVAAQAANAGPEQFLQMMGLISINLAVLNMIPIPVLDGGNLLLYAIEGIKRSPITLRTRQVVTYAGFAFILVIILLVFKNDIERYWPNFAEFFD